MNFNLRTWVTPLTIGAFLLSAVTGVLMFFHIDIGLAHPAHEWLSWLLLGSVALHLTVNWRGFARYFTQRVGGLIVAGFAALTVAALLPLTTPRQPPTAGAMRALHESSIDTVSRVAKRSPDEVLAALDKHGLKVDSADQTVAEIARANGRNPMEVLGAALETATP